MQTAKVYVANEDTMELQLMTQPLVDVTTGDLYLAVDGLETLLTEIKAIQTDGTQKTQVTVLPNPTAGYEQSDYDIVDIVKYYGYVDASGNWYIRKDDTENGTIRFVKGSSGYITAWNGRTGQSYDYFYTVF